MAYRQGSESTDVEVSILVVNYKTPDLTLCALKSVFDQTHDTPFEIIVVDNCSNDGSAQRIKDAYPQVRLIALQKNIGFAAANNLASTHARGHLVLLLNPDTIVLDRAIDNLVAFARGSADARIWGGRTLFEDGSLNPSSCWGRMTLWRLFCRVSGLDHVFETSSFFNGVAYGEWARDSERRVDIVSGCFFLIERALWHELGGFAPIFFMYGEEADLCLRASVVGARPKITPKATIVHIGGASEAVNKDKIIKLLAAQVTLIDRHFNWISRPFAMLLLLAWPASRAFAASLIALVTRSEGWASCASTWLGVWRARREWQAGYPLRASKLRTRVVSGVERGSALPAG